MARVERQTSVGARTWRTFLAREAVEAAAAIRAEPEITHCSDSDCRECADAIVGGPIER